MAARHATFVVEKRNRRWSLVGLRLVVLFLHLVQPMARLTGRMRGGLTPWRRRGPKTRPRFRRTHMTYWRGGGGEPEGTIRKIQAQGLDAGAVVRTGGGFDSWGLEGRGGALRGGRLFLAGGGDAPRQH